VPVRSATLLVLGWSLAASACSKPASPRRAPLPVPSAASPTSAAPPTSASSGPAAPPTIPPREVTALWNAAHRVQDASGFEQLYADSVLYYGVQRPRDACVESKRRFLAKHPDFRQTLIGEVQVTKSSESSARATFIKEVTTAGKTKRYPSYLELTHSAHGWRISVEGDEITDAALNRVAGDWDGDGKLDTLRLVPPKLRDTGSPEDDFGECEGPCNCTVVFPNHDPLTIENCIGGTPTNEGDLDGRPGDEFGLLPSWWTSCWHGYHVFGVRGRTWQRVVDPLSTHCAQWDDGVDAIEKDSAHTQHVIVRETSMEDFRVITRSVRVR
jgi:hypothetical protein